MDECSSDNDDVPGDLDENDSYSQGSSQVASQASAIASSVVGIIDYPQWHTLKADALYDVLTEDSSVAHWKKRWVPANAYGTMVNSMLKEMNSKKLHKMFELEETRMVLAKSVKDKKKQKDVFITMNEQCLKWVATYLTMKCAENDQKRLLKDGGSESTPRVTDNLISRVAHLNTDPASINFLSRIFSGTSHKDKRLALDSKSERTIALWKELADNFFNNAEWKPENEQTDSRIANIDPSEPPRTPWTGEELRSTFSTLRSDMTIKTKNFTSSGQLQEGADHGDGDDEWYKRCIDGKDPAEVNTNWNWGKHVYLYIYLIYGRVAPSWTMRESPSSTRTELGFGTPSSDLSSNGDDSAKKGKSFLSKADLIEIMSAAPTVSTSSSVMSCEEKAYLEKKTELLRLQVEKAQNELHNAKQNTQLERLQKRKRDYMLDIEKCTDMLSTGPDPDESGRLKRNRDHVWVQVFKLQSKIDALEDDVGEND